MPSNWLFVDTQFPTFTGEESVEEKITSLQNYMFMLVEQLRYSLHNLDLTNMNSKAVNDFADPIYARISDGEDKYTELAVQAGKIYSAVYGENGGSEIEQNPNSIVARVASLETGMSTVVQHRSDGIYYSTVDAEGNVEWVKVGGGDITLSGTLTFAAFESETKEELEAAAGAADNVAALANGRYYDGTFINGKSIYSPTIYANEFNVYPSKDKKDNYEDGGGSFNLCASYGGELKHMLEIGYWQEDVYAPVITFGSPASAYASWTFEKTTFSGVYDFSNCEVDFTGATLKNANMNVTAVFA